MPIIGNRYVDEAQDNLLIDAVGKTHRRNMQVSVSHWWLSQC